MFMCLFLKVSCFNICIIEWSVLSKIFISVGHSVKLRFWFDFFSVLPAVNNHCSRYDFKTVNQTKMEVESVAKALCT
jgi:hypothetical protein